VIAAKAVLPAGLARAGFGWIAAPVETYFRLLPM
jgi:hypothetical protein